MKSFSREIGMDEREIRAFRVETQAQREWRLMPVSSRIAIGLIGLYAFLWDVSYTQGASNLWDLLHAAMWIGGAWFVWRGIVLVIRGY